MRRLAPLAVLVFALVPAAEAKAPAVVTLCGARGACVSITQTAAERLPLWHNEGGIAPVAPAPFYVLRYRWTTGGAEETMYLVPSRNAVRRQTPSLVMWYPVPAGTLSGLTKQLDPIAVPPLRRVTVGTRTVQAPRTYLRLLSVGHATNVFPAVFWRRIRFHADAPSPWTVGDLQVSTTGAYLLRDNVVFVIPKWIADRVRRGVSLAG